MVQAGPLQLACKKRWDCDGCLTWCPVDALDVTHQPLCCCLASLLYSPGSVLEFERHGDNRDSDTLYVKVLQRRAAAAAKGGQDVA